MHGKPIRAQASDWKPALLHFRTHPPPSKCAQGSCPLSYFLYFRLTALQFRGELLVVAAHGALDGLVLYEALQCLLP